jgi:hypothetical protein
VNLKSFLFYSLHGLVAAPATPSVKRTTLYRGTHALTKSHYGVIMLALILGKQSVIMSHPAEGIQTEALQRPPLVMEHMDVLGGVSTPLVDALPSLEKPSVVAEELGVVGRVVGLVELNLGKGGRHALIHDPSAVSEDGPRVSLVTVDHGQDGEKTVTLRRLTPGRPLLVKGSTKDTADPSSVNLTLGRDGRIMAEVIDPETEVLNRSSIIFGRESSGLPEGHSRERRLQQPKAVFPVGGGRYVLGALVSGHPLHGPAVIRTADGRQVGVRQ